MALEGYTRDPERLKKALKVMSDKSVVALEPLKIYVPARFQERNLASLSSEIYVLGVLAIVTANKRYGITLTDAMMQLDPVGTQTVLMGGDEYIEFSFDKGSRVFVTVDLVKNKMLLYNIFDEFLSKGNVPWYLEYEDLPHLFDTAEYHAGTKVGGNHAIYEIICAMVGRVHNDRRLYFRHFAKQHKDQLEHAPDFVPFRSVIYNATNTTAKLLGSYPGDGLTSALVNPAQKVEAIEELLRR